MAVAKLPLRLSLTFATPRLLPSRISGAENLRRQDQRAVRVGHHFVRQPWRPHGRQQVARHRWLGENQNKYVQGAIHDNVGDEHTFFS